MRSLLALSPGLGLVLLLSSPAHLLAAPGLGDAQQPAASSFRASDVENYVRILYGAEDTGVLPTIAARYVRPVPPAVLVRTALTGLYEAAQIPVPASLANDLELTANSDLFFQRPLRKYRQQLGDVEAFRNQQDVVISLRALTRVLDPYSGILSIEEVRRTTRIEEQVNGTGIELLDTVPGGTLRIKSVLAGSPAQRAGVRPGDEISTVNGDRVEKLSAAELQPRFGGQSTTDPTVPPVALTPLTITVKHAGETAERKVVLEPRTFRPEAVLGVRRRDDNSWDYLVDRDRRIAHVRLAALSEGTRDELAAALEQYGVDGLNGLVLDLRWCPGGMLKQAVTIPDLFLRSGVIGLTRGRDAAGQQVFSASGLGQFPQLPLVVLINTETTGGGELIAAALQDHGRAVVLGQRSFGKGSVQQLLENSILPLDAIRFRLTQGTLERPSGRALNRFSDSKPSDDWGVRPSAGYDVTVSPELSRRLREWWHLQTLRPGLDDHALPLDTPATDPVQAAALRVLLGTLLSRQQLEQIVVPNLLPALDSRANVVWGVGAGVWFGTPLRVLPSRRREHSN